MCECRYESISDNQFEWREKGCDCEVLVRLFGCLVVEKERNRLHGCIIVKHTCTHHQDSSTYSGNHRYAIRLY